LEFYFQAQTTESQPLNEAKVLIIGEGGAGKTTLAQKLLNPDYQLKEDEASTQGIDVAVWKFDQANGQPFRARIWDFGGQEIYHQTHQFFLSKRSLYILVADSRKEDTDFYYWLRTVYLLGGNSPVIIVKNEKQDRQRDINERQLRGEFLQLEKVFALNLADNRGLEQLSQYLQHRLTTLDHVGIPLPPTWSRVRAILENCTQGRNTLTCHEYFQFCRQQHLTDQPEMLQISDYLHDLGICLHFQDEPALKPLLILKPEWGTTAAYKVLDNTQIRHNLGHFTTTDLEQLWTDDYADYRQELLELMRKFKLCYEIPRQRHHYIAPQLLSENQPCYDWDQDQNLRLRYEYEFMPKGILSRLIVELHEYIAYQTPPQEEPVEDSVASSELNSQSSQSSQSLDREADSLPDPTEEALVWKTGVVVTNGTALAEIKENYPQRTIEIRVHGPRPRDWLLPIAHELDKIHASYNDPTDPPGKERLQVEKLVPCGCDRCQSDPDPWFYGLSILYNLINQGQYQIQCYKTGQLVQVRPLIDGVVDPWRYPDPKTWRQSRHQWERQWDWMGDDSRKIRFFEPTLPTPPQNPVLHYDRQGNTVIIQQPIIQHQEQPTVTQQPQFQGDYVHGDKVRGDKVMGDKVGRDKIGTQINNSPNLAQAIQDLKAIYAELDQTYPGNATLVGAKTLERIENDPSLKQRIIAAGKEAGTAAIEAALDHPAVSITMAGIKGFLEP
jgi:small GTP-binding protein